MAIFGKKISDSSVFPLPNYQLHDPGAFHPVILAKHGSELTGQYYPVSGLPVAKYKQTKEAETFDAKFLGLEPKVPMRTGER